MIVISCPHCGNQLQVEEAWNGQNTNCPVCNQQFVISVPQPQSAPAPAVPQTMQNPQMMQNPPMMQNPQMMSGGMVPGMMYPPQPNPVQKFTSFISGQQETSREWALISLIAAWFLLTQWGSIALFLNLVNSSIFKVDVVAIFLAIFCGIAGIFSLVLSIITKFKMVIFASGAVLLALLIPVVNEIIKAIR